MNIETACDLLGQLVYKPGIVCRDCKQEVAGPWRFTGEDHSNRFEGALRLKIDYPAWQTNREVARTGYGEVISTYAAEPLLIGSIEDPIHLYRAVLANVAKIDSHEAREMFRVLPTHWAPFHPHHEDGMRRWGDVEGDLKFGIA